MHAQITVNRPQGEFLALPHKFRAYVAGFGAGKTVVGTISQANHYLEHPKVNQGYFAPTYSQIRDIFYPTVEEVAFMFGLKVDVKESNKEVHWFNGRKYIGTTICRSMEKPNNIVGFKIGRGFVDELDTLPIDKAQNAWRKIIARLRWMDVANGADVTTTPEGFRFVHKQFVQHVAEKGDTGKYGLIQASTYDNELNLPEDYIDSLVETYTTELIEAYLHGQFVNLTSGTVYRNFDRKVNHSDEVIKEREPLYIGQDFNVGDMASCIFVKRESGWHCVAELVKVFDTPELINTLEEKYPDHNIVIYPDASGKARKTVGASKSDIDLLKQAGYVVKAKSANPRVKDRVISVNTAFSRRQVFVNTRTCKETTRCLEQQPYDKNGEPEKNAGFDHQNDAFGYPIVFEMPVIKPVTRMTNNPFS